LIGKREDILEAVVLSQSAKEVQVMHPRSYATVELRKPQGFKVEGDTVRVVLFEDEMYLLP
jgi:nonsense-mediated mRNA decay protein 3